MVSGLCIRLLLNIEFSSRGKFFEQVETDRPNVNNFFHGHKVWLYVVISVVFGDYSKILQNCAKYDSVIRGFHCAMHTVHKVGRN